MSSRQENARIRSVVIPLFLDGELHHQYINYTLSLEKAHNPDVNIIESLIEAAYIEFLSRDNFDLTSFISSLLERFSQMLHDPDNVEDITFGPCIKSHYNVPPKEREKIGSA